MIIVTIKVFNLILMEHILKYVRLILFKAILTDLLFNYLFVNLSIILIHLFNQLNISSFCLNLHLIKLILVFQLPLFLNFNFPPKFNHLHLFITINHLFI